MPETESLRVLLDQMPSPDGRGMFTENIDKDKIEKAVAAIAKGGPETIRELVSLLAEPGSAADARPHYALHCVVNYALVSRDENLRKSICETLAAQLENKSLLPANRAYLCQEMQWAGRDESCAALGKALLDSDTTDAAATALAAIGGERAAAQLRAAAPAAKGKVRLNIIDALAALVDLKSADLFAQSLADPDREVRVASAVGLGRVGRVDSSEPLLTAAEAARGWERTQITKACLLLAERFAANGEKGPARKIYERLQATRSAKNEQHIREAARRGLAAIG